METQQDPPKSTEDGGSEPSNDALGQLQRLAMLYHSRGRNREAQEIYQLIVQIKKTGSSTLPDNKATGADE